MTSLVDQVVGVWKGSDGATVDIVYDGDQRDSIERRAPLRALKEPKEKVSLYLRRKGWGVARLPFVASTYRLPDCTGVVANFVIAWGQRHLARDRLRVDA